MSANSTIEWTDATWNIVTGCEQIPGVKGRPSGCDNCYAKRLIDTRQIANPKSPRYGKPFETVMLHPERFGQPLQWRRPRKIFVNSLSDLFHKDVPDEFIARAWWVMGQSAGYLDPTRYRGHVFQILTKRPDRMRRWVVDRWGVDSSRQRMIENLYGPNEGEAYDWMSGPKWWPTIIDNVWLGTSISTNDDAWRADMLRATPAAVRFLSLEPLLGPVDKVDFTLMDWVIVGGESGHGARPMHPEWARDIRDRCREMNIPLFFKQWGGWANVGADVATHALHECGKLHDHDPSRPGVIPDSQLAPGYWAMMKRVGKKKAGRVLDGRTWDEFPHAG